ncbi:MAG: flagellar hook capping FlgD N-terminal domain-containing protein [Planctomycetaceae bacterium]
MEIPAAGGSAATPEFVSRDKVGFAGMTSDDFMTLLIAELQNQDPSEPVKNADLLNQLSVMRNLAANVEMAKALKAITSNQQLSTASTFIGKVITGTATDDSKATGIVDRAFLRDGEAFVSVGDQEVPLDGVTTVAAA